MKQFKIVLINPKNYMQVKVTWQNLRLIRGQILEKNFKKMKYL